MVVLIFVCDTEHVQYLDKNTLISVDFDECVVKSWLVMEIWVCSEDVAAGGPVDYGCEICFDRLNWNDLLTNLVSRIVHVLENLTH